MRTDVVMPQMGESVTEGTVTQWLKSIGDFVERDEPLFEITTDKVDAEIPSPVAGVLVEWLAQIGQTVEINTIVAVIDTEAKAGEVAAAPLAAASAAAISPGAAAVAHAETARPMGALAAAEALGTAATVDDLRRTKSTPLVRRIAAEHAISDLSAVAGTGMSGRVTKQDILQYIASGSHAQPANQCAKGRNGHPGPALARETRAPSITVGDRDRVEVMGPQRLAIAEHMIRSRATSAHANTVHEVDFSRVARVRAAMQAEFEERGVKLSYTAFIVKAIADALVEFPVVNSSVDGDTIIYRGEINIGVAVALADSLIVPVIRNVDELSLLGIARAIADLAERARTKRLKPDEVRGGTFTLSNHGIFGPEFGIPIINQPQSAIVSTGAIKKRVVVDQDTDGIVVRPTSIWCMSFDHRVIDGATADRFMARMRTTLESWQNT
ncbi:MAG: 2-oxo acid dehydrogenase subunit E2 [Bradymonadaceae bacterium]|nr:2-oxo acid dehydrogenase subunit E2 [Lujinxingiaceae bacterium]